MDKPHVYYGMTFKGRRCIQSERLEGRRALEEFLKAHLYDEEIRVTDAMKQRVLLHVRNGVYDVGLSRPEELGVSLPEIYEDIRRSIVVEEGVDSHQRESWEDLYDSIGVSPDEIRMRQRLKPDLKSVRTVTDVAKLIEGTYFDASFKTEDGNRSWGYFDGETFTVTPMIPVDGPLGRGWQFDSGKRVQLDPDARIQHCGSGEDVHGFIILDPPVDP